MLTYIHGELTAWVDIVITFVCSHFVNVHTVFGQTQKLYVRKIHILVSFYPFCSEWQTKLLKEVSNNHYKIRILRRIFEFVVRVRQEQHNESDLTYSRLVPFNKNPPILEINNDAKHQPMAGKNNNNGKKLRSETTK
jgi:hypothetical protein